MVTVEALEDFALDDAAGLKAQLGDSPAGPGAGRLAAFLRWGEVVADALVRRLGAGGWFGGADLPPRVGSVVALGDGDNPSHALTSSPAARGPPGPGQPAGGRHDH